MKNDDIGEARGASKRALVWVPLLLAIALFAFADHAAEGAPAAEGGAGAAGDLAGIGITRLVAIITGIGALGMAAFSLVDAFKTLPGGGASKLGYAVRRRSPAGPAARVAMKVCGPVRALTEVVISM